MSSKFRGGFLRLCGIRRLRKKCKNKAIINRKYTFNTTTSSTHHSSQHTSDSIFSRYSSNRNASSKYTNSIKETKDQHQCNNSEKENLTKMNSIERSLRESYVRISSMRNGESYV